MHKYSHSDIVDYVASISDKLSNNNNPEDVLIKYARDNNLPSAVLQKMAQVYNTAKTVNYMEKSATRGDSFKVIDTEELVKLYEDSKGLPEKHENKKSASETDEINEISSLFNIYEEEIEKSAGSYTEYPVYQNPKTLFKEADDKMVNAALLEEIIADNKAVIRKNITKIAEEARSLDGLNFPELEEQIVITYGDGSFEFINKLANVLTEYNIVVDRKDFNIKKSSYIRKEHRLLNTVKEIVEADILIKEAVISADEEIKEKRKKEKENNQGKYNPPTPATPPKRKNPEQKNETHTLGGEIVDKSTDYLQGSVVGKPKTTLLDTLADKSNKYVNEPFIQEIKKLIADGMTTNKLQQSTDYAELDSRQEMTFNNLILTDPILQDADEDMTREVFESVKELSPFIASSPIRLRAVLREAAQYDTVSPFVLQTLVDFELKKIKAESERSAMDASKYKLPSL